MSKRKYSRNIPGEHLLKLHLILYVIGMIMLGLSLLATFDYPGNATGDFAVFRPFIEDRIAVMILWGVLVLGHGGVQQIRGFLYNRAQRLHLNSVYADDYERLRDHREIQAEDGYYHDVLEMKAQSPETEH